MAVFINRNKGGEPRQVSPMGYKTLHGDLISNLRNVSLQQLREIDVFVLSEHIEPSVSAYQVSYLDRYEWDVATMTVTAFYTNKWQELGIVKASAQQEIEALTHQAVEDGFTWNGDVYDGRDVLVPNAKGQVLIRSVDKTNIMHIQQQMQAGIIDEMDWKVGENLYIRITGLDVIAQISSGGLIYESKVLGLRKRFVADVSEAKTAEKVDEIIRGVRAAFDEVPGRWKGE